jgi:hypothetical protein
MAFRERSPRDWRRRRPRPCVPPPEPPRSGAADAIVLADELVHARVLEYAVAVLVDVDAVRQVGRLPVEAHAERDRVARSSRQHDVRIARVKPKGDGPAGPVERQVLGPDGPFAVECPAVEAQAFGTLVGRAHSAFVAEVCLRGEQLVPVGSSLHARPFDRHELTLDAQEPLDDALGLLVAAFAEVVVADHALRVHEVERRPRTVGEAVPDRVGVVDSDRIVDRSLIDRPAHAVDVVLERELRRMDAEDDQTVVPVGPRPRADVRLLSQPVDARPRPEVHEHHMASQLGRTEWLGVEPPGRAGERGHAHTFEQGHG